MLVNYVVGQCSLCGGDVVTPANWLSVDPPVPTCRVCGAVKANESLVVKMVPVKGGLTNWEKTDG